MKMDSAGELGTNMSNEQLREPIERINRLCRWLFALLIGQFISFSVAAFLLPIHLGWIVAGMLLTVVMGAVVMGLARSIEALDKQRQATHVALSQRARQQVVEAERLRIARDMHDTVAQSLFGLSMGLEGTQSLVRQAPAEAEQELADMMGLVASMRDDLREIIFDLWPDELTASRFSADLHRYLADLTDNPPILDLDIRGDFAPLSPYARRSLYRICQESLTNAVNHAQASNIRICLDINKGRARLVVRDDGVGFMPVVVRQQLDGGMHFGLRGMEERAHTLSGTFDLFSQPNEGTSIVVDVPVNSAETV